MEKSVTLYVGVSAATESEAYELLQKVVVAQSPEQRDQELGIDSGSSNKIATMKVTLKFNVPGENEPVQQ